MNTPLSIPTVRSARWPEDSDRIMDLLLQVNNIHAEGRPDLFRIDSTKYTINQLRDIIENPLTPVFVCVNERDEVTGYCFCMIEDHSNSTNRQKNKTLYIDDLCVSAECRGLGIGRLLYNHVKQYALEHSFHNITLNVWNNNQSAMRFYESLGMKIQKIGMEEVL